MIDLDKILKDAERVGICGHVRPDADAFGSCMGLYLFLKKYYPSINCRVFLENTWSKTFSFVASSDEITDDFMQTEPYDVFFSLDASDPERIGDAVHAFNHAKVSVVIDHHISNTGFGSIREVQPNASSTSELVALMIGKERITKQIAEPLYLGIAHDTGVFHYSCTSSRTLEVAGWLIDTGIDFPKIVDSTFFEKTYVQNQILGRALAESIMMLDNKVIFSSMKRKVLSFYHVLPGDLEGIVQQLRLTKGVEVAIFLYETEDNRYKVSLRSNGKVDVAAIAVELNGGGHKLAAGCTVEGRMHDIVNLIVKRVEDQLRNE